MNIPQSPLKSDAFGALACLRRPLGTRARACAGQGNLGAVEEGAAPSEGLDLARLGPVVGWSRSSGT